MDSALAFEARGFGFESQVDRYLLYFFLLFYIFGFELIISNSSAFLLLFYGVYFIYFDNSRPQSSFDGSRGTGSC